MNKREIRHADRLENIKKILTAPLLVALIVVVGVAGFVGRVIFEIIFLIAGRRP